MAVIFLGVPEPESGGVVIRPANNARTFLTNIDGNNIASRIDHLEENGTGAKIGYVTLLASAWEGSGRVHSQVVSIEGVTANSQVDLTPDIQQLATFNNKDLTFVTENYGGQVTVYAVGQKPANDYTSQVTITEVGA